MDYNRPEGCKAAVTSGWETTYSGGVYSRTIHQKFTAKVYCGERQATCDDSFNEGPWQFNHEYYSRQTVAAVSAQVSEVLGAICLGCPYNKERAGSS